MEATEKSGETSL
jgi:hypothetical protein